MIVRATARTRVAVITLLALVTAVHTHAGPNYAGQDDPPSLEELLRRAHDERRALRAELAPKIRDLVSRLEATALSAADADALQAEIVALGPEAAPLLVAHIDPGSGESVRARLRATQVTRAIVTLGSPSITGELIRLTSNASRLGRLHAIELLGYSAHRDRASPRLTALFGGTSGETRRAAAAALARLGGERNASFLQEALSDTDVEVVAAVLRALIAAPSASGTQAVMALLRRPTEAVRSLDLILEYLRLASSQTENDPTQDLLVLAADKRIPAGKRIAVLAEIPAFEPSLDAALRRRLDPILASPDTAVSEAGRICLALLGDRPARRALIRSYDEHVAQNARWPTAYYDRGQVLMRLHEYGDAARDFRESIDLSDARGKPAEFEIWIDLARAHVLDHKLKQASDALREAPIPGSVLTRLGEDPDFEELREHSRYGRLFER